MNRPRFLYVSDRRRLERGLLQEGDLLGRQSRDSKKNGRNHRAVVKRATSAGKILDLKIYRSMRLSGLLLD